MTVRFYSAEEPEPRPWGREVIVALTDSYSGKVLYVTKGSKGGLQKHHLKDETAYVFSGKLLFRYDEGDGILRSRVLGPGDCVHIPPGSVHQEEALEDCILFEAGTPHTNDRLRVEEAYGLEIPPGGLPSTTIEEVKVGNTI